MKSKCDVTVILLSCQTWNIVGQVALAKLTYVSQKNEVLILPALRSSEVSSCDSFSVVSAEDPVYIKGKHTATRLTSLCHPFLKQNINNN
jgi:hypothetical protein